MAHGWADVNDSPSEAVEREIVEESGFQAKAERMFAVFDRAKHGHEPPMPFHVYKLFLLCRLERGEASHLIGTGQKNRSVPVPNRAKIRGLGRFSPQKWDSARFQPRTPDTGWKPMLCYLALRSVERLTPCRMRCPPILGHAKCLLRPRR
jgi:ADP-ribose pyrophosphatase YjhB (NUDIX family)